MGKDAYRVLLGKPERKRHLKYSGLDGRIILKLILEKWGGKMDLIELGQDRDRWQALVNAVMNLPVP